MPVSTRILGLLWFIAACGFPKPADVVSCTANEFVVCDANAAQMCNATGDGLVMQDCGTAGCNADARRCNQCVPNADSCGATANEIDRCGPDGLPAGQDTCLLGCKAAPVAHCTYIEPRYVPDACDAIATMPAFMVSNSASFDTSLDNNCTGGVVHQDSPPDICVARYGSIHITETGVLTVLGGRELALVADAEITIDGILDVSAVGFRDGPGGGAVISGDKVGTNGGGGAGFATAGGAGGSTIMDGNGGRGGGQATDPSLVTVLLGGTCPASVPGGGGAPIRGGGGGAATLIACRGTVSVSGVIAAGGGGGGGGKFGTSMSTTFAGAGGGSGGNIVLQGLSITVTGQVFANGGGGGAGLFHPSGGTAQAGGPGGDGSRSTTVGASGGSPSGTAGAGGGGGRQGAAPGVGLRPSDSSSGLPGGGGGSVGFFQTYTPTGITPTLAPSAASPSFSTNKTITTR